MARDPEFVNSVEFSTVRNRTPQRLAWHDAPRVGMFWFLHELDQLQRISPDCNSVRTVETEGTCGKYSTNHDAPWRNLKRIRRGVKVMSHLDGSGPADCPRGQVVLNTVTKRFDVYLARQIHNPQFKTTILECFHLQTAETSYTDDPSYADASFIVGADGPRRC